MRQEAAAGEARPGFPAAVAGSDRCSGLSRRRQSIIVCAMGYAGSTSVLRIVDALCRDAYSIRAVDDENTIDGNPQASSDFADYRPWNHIYCWRSLYHLERSLQRTGVDKRDYKFIVCWRDPRDVLPSLYFSRAWTHMPPPDPVMRERFFADREALQKISVDQYCLDTIDWVETGAIRPMLAILDGVPAENVCHASYALLCLDFPAFLDRLLDFIPVPDAPAKVRRILATEDVLKRDSMPTTSNVHYAHASPLPGRHRRDLQPATIDILDRRYRSALDWMAANDLPRFRELYR